MRIGEEERGGVRNITMDRARDDIFPHEVYNVSDEPRIAIYIDIVRDLCVCAQQVTR